MTTSISTFRRHLHQVSDRDIMRFTTSVIQQNKGNAAADEFVNELKDQMRVAVVNSIADLLQQAENSEGSDSFYNSLPTTDLTQIVPLLAKRTGDYVGTTVMLSVRQFIENYLDNMLLDERQRAVEDEVSLKTDVWTAFIDTLLE